MMQMKTKKLEQLWYYQVYKVNQKTNFNLELKAKNKNILMAYN